MKKALLIPLALIAIGCREPNPRTHGDRWIVEDKNAAYGHSILKLSDAADPSTIIHIEVGEYTFSKTTVGDTLNCTF